ncbi:hypothetical protein [Spiroplasma clarkii]|uniref:Transmembrane protein n=1 Tax=Spiroplasma clarkii TaxID=2139 RepID=A0A2K8KFD7_9MOLU|nr:hypothetical protein [Spiroplasma clarkii]ATX70407.1 hypothetical protein SCLAR_v1c00720 [Spiroplasma clarkii]
MSNLEIYLLVGGILGTLGLIGGCIYLVIAHQKHKQRGISITPSHEQRFIYVFFRRWLVVFIVFALALISLFCWVQFFVEICK